MKNKTLKIALSGMIILLVLSAIYIPVSAKESFGSVTFKIEYEGKAVSGGNLNQVRFAQLSRDRGCFEWTQQFEQCSLHLFEFEEAEFSAGLLKYINQVNSRGKSKIESGSENSMEKDTEMRRTDGSGSISYENQNIDKNGNIKFEGLEEGLYLFWQSEPSEGYEKMQPFVVSIPINEGGKEVYDIVAYPKPRPKKKELPSTPDSTKPASSEPYPAQPDDVYNENKLPQTGLLMWPIPGFFLYGIFFILLGVIIRMDGEKNEN